MDTRVVEEFCGEYSWPGKNVGKSSGGKSKQFTSVNLDLILTWHPSKKTLYCFRERTVTCLKNF